MEKTRKMLKEIITGKECFKKTNDLIQEYQRDLSPNILAYFYDDNFGIICSIARFYPILSSEDIASFCLQELDKALLNFNAELNIKFSTYFAACLKNRLRTEIELLNTNKRKAIYNYEQFENTDISYEDKYFDSLTEAFNNYNFTWQEKYQCLLRMAGYSLKEIAKMFNISNINIYKRNQKIKQKILQSYIN